MKIEYEIKDEEFPVFLAALNNGFLSLVDTYWALKLGCQVPTRFEKLRDNLTDSEIDILIDDRLKAFNGFYKYLEKLEKEINTR